MATTTSKAKETARQAESTMTEMAEQALKNWEKAFRSGMKLQEDAGKWWSDSMTHVQLGQDWQKRMMQFSSMAGAIIPQAQKQMEQAMDIVGQNTRAAGEIYQKAIDAAQSPLMPDRDSKWMELWTASMRALRSNTEAIMELNNQAFNAWLQVMRKSETSESRAKST